MVAPVNPSRTMDECNASPILFSISSLVSFHFSPAGQNIALQAPRAPGGHFHGRQGRSSRDARGPVDAPGSLHGNLNLPQSPVIHAQEAGQGRHGRSRACLCAGQPFVSGLASKLIT